MFGVDSTELFIVVVAALIFIPSKDLPIVMRNVGRWIGKVRGYARHFTSGIENMVREAELEEMEQRWREENQRILGQHPADAHYSEPLPPAGLPDAMPPLVEEHQPDLPLEAPAAPDNDPLPPVMRPLP